MTKTCDVYSYLVKNYPLRLQEKWDQSGKIVYFNKPIKRVLVCLDLNEETVMNAISGQYDLIVSHHPIFTKSTKDHPVEKKDKRLISLLKTTKTPSIALHTCFDNSPNGMNVSFLKKYKIFKNIKFQKTPCGTYALADLNRPTTLNELQKLFAKTLKTSRTIGFGNKTDLIKKVVVCLGSGFSVLKQPISENNKDTLFITGDVKWHDWQYAKTYRANVLDIGHDAENIFVGVITNLLTNKFKDIAFTEYPSKLDLTIIK